MSSIQENCPGTIAGPGQACSACGIVGTESGPCQKTWSTASLAVDLVEAIGHLSGQPYTPSEMEGAVAEKEREISSAGGPRRFLLGRKR